MTLARHFPGRSLTGLIVFLACLGMHCSTSVRADDSAKFKPEELTFFQQKVRPLLKARCDKCHGANVKEPKGGLRLHSRKAALTGGESGPAIVPGNTGASLLVKAINYDELEMPPRSKLPAGEIAILTRWVNMGLPWPKGDVDVPITAPTRFPLEERRASHWAWQPITHPDIPAVKQRDWPGDDIDRFILAGLEAAGLQPAADADRRTLIRRVYLDLIGLPPEPAAVASFVDDPQPTREALAKVVDQLLASQHFGERWARHWLDQVRYAETLGHEFDFPLHHAFEYRDYVIRAMNADVPYDRFVTEHIAGDLLDEPRRHPTEGFNESLIATGFWYLSEDKHAPVDVRGEEAARIDNQIDVFSKTFLGLTVACARCHDHKFDAILTQDYYSLAGYLQSSRRQVGLLDPHGKISRASDELLALHEQGRQQTAQAGRKISPEDLDRLTAVAGKSAGQPQHPLFVWSQLSKATPDRFVEHRNRLAERVSQLVQQAADRESKSVLFEDFSAGFDGWFATGWAFGPGPTTDPDWLAPVKSGGIVSAGIAHSGRYAHRQRGVLRSSTFELKHKQILYRVAGKNCRIRLIIDGYVMDDFSGLLFGGAKQKVDHGAEFRWIRQAQDVSRYVGHRCHIEILDEGDGWIAVDEIRFTDGGPDPGTPISGAAQALLTNAGFDSKQALADAYSGLLTGPGQQRATSELLAAASAEAAAAVNAAVADTRAKMESIANVLPHPRPVIAITDGSGENEYVFIRGSHNNLGTEAPRRMLTAIAGDDQPDAGHRSGRLELAQRMFDPQNPFPPRVMANRLWHHLFGRGIVASTDNFGVLGQRPTHPELLDHLANRLVANDWSLKSMIRELVLTRSYRMDSVAEAAHDERDPENLLLHRFNLKRLQGEVIRDSMLAISGRLDRTLFGKAVPVHLTAFMQGRGRPGKSGPLDGNGRRSIYVSVNRNFLSPMMLAFDTPIPFTSIGKRSVSNVPAQALILMNDPFVIEQADRWAKRILSEATSTQGRIQLLHETAFARPADEQEMRQAIDFLETQAKALSIDDWTSDERVWGDLCHVMMNVKEFVYLR